MSWRVVAIGGNATGILYPVAYGDTILCYLLQFVESMDFVDEQECFLLEQTFVILGHFHSFFYLANTTSSCRELDELCPHIFTC